MSEPAHWSLAEAAEAIAARRISSCELLDACQARIERLQPLLNCFIGLDAERARRMAEAADAALARGDAVGPLHGVPLAHKDMYYRAGRVSTCGSRIRRDFVPDHTATVLERLDAAGALDLGGLNMAEFAVGPTGHNIHWGHCRNPWNPDHVTGGSSSGSGSAVAGRLVFGALGSDTGGSVRLPASMCGLVGIKPTQARVSRYGIMGLSFSLDNVGPLTRTVRDGARLLRVIAGHDPRDPTSSRLPVPDYEAGLELGVKGVRIGVPTNYYYDDAADEVRALMRASLDRLASLGAEIVELAMPDHDQLSNLAGVVLTAEAATLHGAWLRERPQDINPQMRARIEPGLAVPATHYLRALHVRDQVLARFIDQVFKRCDVLHAPSLKVPVPTITETDVGDGPQMGRTIGSLTHCTRTINYLGLPSVSVPAGFTANGMPSGFQLIGRPFAEAQILRVAAAYEAAADWVTRAPSLAA